MSNNPSCGITGLLVSSFLRERGIRAPQPQYRHRNQTNDTSNPQQQNNNNTDNADDGEVDESIGTGRTGRRGRRGPPPPPQTPALAPTSEDQTRDDPEAEEEVEYQEPAPTTSTKSTPRKRSRATPKKKKRESDSEDEDALNNPLAPRSRHTKRKKKGVDDEDARDRMLLRICKRCTRRIPPNAPAADEMCPACVTITAAGGKGAPKAPKKKTKKSVAFDDNTRFPSLRDLCMKYIAERIDDVEAFGDIPEETKTRISKIICRLRKLNPKNLQLFLGPEEERVDLFDCPALTDPDFITIAHFCPNLQRLYLNNAGRLTDAALIEIGKLDMLSVLELKGCFKCTENGWSTILGGLGPKLNELTLRYAAKFGQKSMEVLTIQCPNLQKLALIECESVDDVAVQKISRLQSLHHLQLDRLGAGISDVTLTDVIIAVGKSLRVLSLVGYPNATDLILFNGIVPHCPVLTSLILSECDQLTPDGFVTFLNKFHSPTRTFERLDLSRNVLFTDAVVTSVMNLYGPNLVYLGLNGLDELTGYSLKAVAGESARLEELDVSWVRALDDEAFIEIVRGCGKLRRVGLYGCNRLTDVVLGNGRVFKNGAGDMIQLVGNEYS
ncbi:hypothetical protein BJ742DRAFT_881312 [Cladochytrium replicatum]|nr:hypothetical protein BJ742DRAFT_881312 [Cladochytrium replicatum]